MSALPPCTKACDLVSWDITTFLYPLARMATTNAPSFAFYTTVKAPPEFHDFIRKLVSHVRLSKRETPPVTDEDIALYIQAFVGPSSKPVIGNNVETNKHLEFVGDATLNLSATLWLHRKFRCEDVGRLTHRRQCMVGSNSGLMDLAKYLGLEAFVFGQFNRGGKKLLPNVVEAILGVMQQLHGFDYVDAFLWPLFDQLASEWFDRYLPEGVKMDIAKSASSITTQAPSTLDSRGLTELPPQGATMSFRNELDEYLLNRRVTFPTSTSGNLCVSYERAGENNRTQWIARAQIEGDSGEIIYRSARAMSKREAQNEACCLLLKVIQANDAEKCKTDNQVFAHPSSSSFYADTTPSHIPSSPSPTPPRPPFYNASSDAIHLKRPRLNYPSNSQFPTISPSSSSSSSSVDSHSAMRHVGTRNQLMQPLAISSSSSVTSAPNRPLNMHQPPPTETPPQPLFSISTISDLLPTSNYKGTLLTFCQRNWGSLVVPEYTSSREGPHNAPYFSVRVKVGEFDGYGQGPRRLEAEKIAAKMVLSKMCGM